MRGSVLFVTFLFFVLSPLLAKKKPRTGKEALFGKEYATYQITSNELSGACFYLVSGHGGTDPGATMTTVGYGDITPETPLGRFLSAIVMLLGYTIIAVPTGIVSASMIQEHRRRVALKCPHCGKDGHEDGAAYCKYCGGKLVN